jgi:hypothetical protein
MGGDASQWTEGGGGLRPSAGGAAARPIGDMISLNFNTYSFNDPADDEGTFSDYLGFRVASVALAEPSTVALSGCGLAILVLAALRRRAASTSSK